MTKSEIANILKQLRTSSGLTQKEVAQQLNIKQQTLSTWENASALPDANILFDICKLYGVTVDEAFGFGKTLINNDEQILIKKYRTLDKHGKNVVDLVLNEEHTRCTTPAEEPESNVIYFSYREYVQPVSAGTGDWNDSDDFEKILLKKEAPRGTSFLVRVHGDSMEPTYCDGDRLFIRSQNTLEDGQIGIFCTNGEMFVKELRGGRLMSHNKTYKPIPLTEDTYCQGRVLGVCTEDYFEE